MFAVLFHAAPNVKMPGFRWVSLGAVVAVVVWIVASALFAFYVANFGSYNKTYGALGGVVIGLVWLWLTNCALLLGLELNAERERSARAARRRPARRGRDPARAARRAEAPDDDLTGARRKQRGRAPLRLVSRHGCPAGSQGGDVTGILDGMRIIEGSAFVAAPLGGMTMAQLGAEVIRFDPIGGGLDRTRWPITADGQSLFWVGLNKGKRSIQVDLGSEEGRAIAAALITAPGPEAGLFLTNFPARGSSTTTRSRRSGRT